ncbi:MAG: hypothetical protein ACXWB3_07350 [Kaistella sp.]
MNREKCAEFSLLDNKLLFNKHDSLLFVIVSERVAKFSDSCRINKLNCYYDNETGPAAYPSGVNMFRKHFADQLNLKKFIRASDSNIKIIIGKQGNIKNVKISGLQNEEAKNEIIRVLKLPQLNSWHSANTVLGKSESEVTFRLLIK